MIETHKTVIRPWSSRKLKKQAFGLPFGNVSAQLLFCNVSAQGASSLFIFLCSVSSKKHHCKSRFSFLSRKDQPHVNRKQIKACTLCQPETHPMDQWMSTENNHLLGARFCHSQSQARTTKKLVSMLTSNLPNQIDGYI